MTLGLALVAGTGLTSVVRATGCAVDGGTVGSSAGGQSASASTACDVGGRSGEADVSARYTRNEAALLVTEHNGADLDGDGAFDTSGSSDASAGCGPPSQWGMAKNLACPALTGP